MTMLLILIITFMNLQEQSVPIIYLYESSRSSPEEAWELAGVSAWRKGCGGVGERPRLYEQVDLDGDGDGCP